MANAFEAAELNGTWSFYEQDAAGNVVSKKVTITLNKDGSYHWVDNFWRQNGTWSVEENRLMMSNVGSHKLISITADEVEMKRGSTMGMRKGSR
ncbi:hypothetical protein ACJJIE_07710 [Microbulbifer sp. TRSA001]|uniref:hypothetical protein n=1 Tax=Microbulbifer sp. TRSA001 TaxID=3243381 RepID=UPI004039759A